MQSISFSALKEEELQFDALSNQALPEFFKAQSFLGRILSFPAQTFSTDVRPKIFL